MLKRDWAPPEVRKNLAEYGSMPVIEYTIARHPIDEGLKKIANLLSLGQFEKNKKKLAYDDVYHLFLLLKVKDPETGKVHILKAHKESVVRLTLMQAKEFQDLLKLKPEYLQPVAIAQPKPLLLWFNDAEKKLKQNMWSYSSTSNNCQDFVVAMLAGQTIDPATIRWIKQDGFELISRSNIVNRVLNFITDLDAIADRVKRGGDQASELASSRSGNL